MMMEHKVKRGSGQKITPFLMTPNYPHCAKRGFDIPSFLRYQPGVGLTLPLTDIFKPTGEKKK
jgi:hypothetical protein